MIDIAAWLEQLGLAKYAPIFSENEGELAELSELSEDDLKEIGLPLGPRHRIVATGTVHLITATIELGETGGRH